jgi:hypothetical protein
MITGLDLILISGGAPLLVMIGAAMARFVPRKAEVS